MVDFDDGQPDIAISPTDLIRKQEAIEESKKEFVPEEVNREYGLCDKKTGAARGTVCLHGMLGDVAALSPEEEAWSKQMKDTFQKYDANSDGVIDRKELATLLSALSANLVEADVDTLMTAADRDGNGKIDYDEFVDWLMRPASASTGRALMNFSKAFEKLFKAYDRKDQGRITREDFQECHCILQAALRLNNVEDDCPHRADPLSLKEDHEEAFRMSDQDGSGCISFLEFVEWMKDHIPSGMSEKAFMGFATGLAEQLASTFEHMQMAEEGYIQEKDAHVLKNVINKLADSARALGKGMTEKKETVKPCWSDPPIGLSVERLKSAHMALIPLNTRRVDKIVWEILCLPMQGGDWEDPEERIWLAEVVRRVQWKTGKSTTEEPEYYAYDRKTFSWAPICDKSEVIFQDTFEDLSPGIGIFCLIKTAANFGQEVNWEEVENALEGAVDMSLITNVELGKFNDYMMSVANQALRADGMIDNDMSPENQARYVQEWLSEKFKARPREVMATLSDLRIVKVEAAWADFEAL